LERAVELHGHLGPFLILGLKMGLRAERLLGGRVRTCEVEVIGRKPYLCTVDGVRAVIGDNVVVKEGDGIVATFHEAGGKEVVVRVKEEVIKRYAHVPWEQCKEKAHEVLGENEENLLGHCLFLGYPSGLPEGRKV